MAPSEPVHHFVALNRFIDLGFTFYNTLTALMLLTAPWYKLTQDVTFQGCPLSRGTVLAPFASGMCDTDTFKELKDGGDKWGTMHTLCIIFMTLTLITSCLVGYESIEHGFRKWENGNTLSFTINLFLIVVLAVMLGGIGSVPKPEHIENELATIMTIIAMVLSCLRVPMLGVFMYHTYHDPNRQKGEGGYFGTGAYI